MTIVTCVPSERTVVGQEGAATITPLSHRESLWLHRKGWFMKGLASLAARGCDVVMADSLCDQSAVGFQARTHWEYDESFDAHQFSQLAHTGRVTPKTQSAGGLQPWVIFFRSGHTGNECKTKWANVTQWLE